MNLNDGDMNTKPRHIDNYSLYITIQCHLFNKQLLKACDVDTERLCTLLL
jgi:hypothetical protein